jgi:Domain of unknown function (DUF4249)
LYNRATISSFTCIALAAATGACKQTYAPPAVANPPSYLVVEGFINNGPDSTYYTLSHTYKLNDSTGTTPETGAVVTVEGSDNSAYTLGEVGNGGYGAKLPALNATTTYRLHIVTTANKQYASDYVPLVPDPPIDSIGLIRNYEGDALICANTHDPTNTARYFRWDFSETWEFDAAFIARYLVVNNTVQEYAPDTMYTCWRGDNSSQIVLATTSNLAQDIVSQAPMVNIPLNGQQLSIEYSILAHQYAITPAAFNWWSIMQNNTENIGSIFGVQPSTDQGNIHCLSDTAEEVIGYVSAGTVQSRRQFFTNARVAPWVYTSPCQENNTVLDSVLFFYSTGLWPADAYNAGNNTSRIHIAPRECVDCTANGTNIKPSFWQ